MKSPIHFYWFSGTGNTLLVVQNMAEFFSRAGLEVMLHKIETTQPQTVSGEGTVGLAFPVAFQSTYPFIWDFIDTMPDGANETEVFMVDTLAAFSGGIVGPLRKMLQKKGYRPIGADEIAMPNNFFPSQTDAGNNQDKIDKGIERSRQYARRLLDGSSSWGRVPVVSDVLYRLSRGSLARNIMRSMGKKLVVDTDTCTRCGTCAKLCPVDNILVEPGGLPVFHDKCNMCMRCISFCPVEAIGRASGKTYSLHRAVTAAELL